jgi:hypothetical protein
MRFVIAHPDWRDGGIAADRYATELLDELEDDGFGADWAGRFLDTVLRYLEPLDPERDTTELAELEFSPTLLEIIHEITMDGVNDAY